MEYLRTRVWPLRDRALNSTKGSPSEVVVKVAWSIRSNGRTFDTPRRASHGDRSGKTTPDSLTDKPTIPRRERKRKANPKRAASVAPAKAATELANPSDVRSRIVGTSPATVA